MGPEGSHGHLKRITLSRREELQKLEPEYRKAKYVINSSAFKDKERDTLLRLAAIVMAFRDDDPPHKAVAIVVRCQEAINGVEPLYRLVQEYEGKRDGLDRITGIMGQQ